MRASDDRGQATAETAAVVPCLALLLAMMMWGLLVAAAQIQCVDAARAGARAAARGESRATALAAARAVAPEGARVRLSRHGEELRVRVSARPTGPGPLTVGVHAEAVAHVERG
ncbi:TadE family type IV pilus minor pilin [Streptomyces chumphonensis]|uniref:TadE family type IV pilus minor pilin n=1 Tax=Streptomyces chumphonensis TaxID=1214925 RepID=UPI003D707D60